MLYARNLRIAMLGRLSKRCMTSVGPITETLLVKAHVKSECKEGTVLKGINILARGTVNIKSLS